MPKIVKAMVVRVILGVVSVLSLATAGSTPDHKSLIPARALTTSSLVGADDSDDGGFTRTTELSVEAPPLQLPPVDQATVAGNSLNHYIIQMDGEHVRDQRCGHTTPKISTITSTTTTISNNLTGPTTSSSSSRTSEIITGTNSSLSTISTNPTETSKTGEIITRTNSSLPTISTNSTETRTSEIIIGTNSSLPTISTNPAETSRTCEIIIGTNSSLPSISTNPPETGSLNTGTPKEGQEEDSFQLGRTLLGLTFEAAVALMVSRFQLQGNSSSPPSSSSSSCPPPRPPSSSLASVLSSFPFAMVWATIVCGFTVTLMGVILRKAHSAAAKICNYAGIFSVALGFFLMMEKMCIPERFVWLVWAAAGILVLVFAYALARRSGKKE